LAERIAVKEKWSWKIGWFDVAHDQHHIPDCIYIARNLNLAG